MENRTGTQPPPPEPNGVPAPQFVYLQPGQQAVYVQPPPGQQPMHQPPPSQPPVYQQPMYQPPYRGPLPPSSGVRISAGIVGIILGIWNVFASLFILKLPTSLIGFLTFCHLIAALAVLVLGIMIIVNHRRRTVGIPAILLGSTTLLIIVDLVMVWIDWFIMVGIFTLAGGIPTAALAGFALIRERKAAKQTA